MESLKEKIPMIIAVVVAIAICVAILYFLKIMNQLTLLK